MTGNITPIRVHYGSTARRGSIWSGPVPTSWSAPRVVPGDPQLGMPTLVVDQVKFEPVLPNNSLTVAFTYTLALAAD